MISLILLYFASYCSKRLAPISPPIRIKTNLSQLGRFPASWAVNRLISLSSHLFLVLFSFVLIGGCDYFGFCITDSQSKTLFCKERYRACHVSIFKSK